MQEPTGFAWPWLLATLVFLVLLGAGRTLRGGWLGRPPVGAGVALSVALGLLLFSLVFVVLGHVGAIGSPWPQAMLALGVLLALPGLVWTVGDHRSPTPGLERGFGLGWLGGAAWVLMLAALLVSLVWITGAFEWEARGYLFERVGVDHEIGRVAFDPERPRDPFLGGGPLGLWLYGLGAAEATLALAWWLGVALLFGVCGLGWRLHSHGAGLLAAMVFAIVLFASDRPLFLAPALPATVALLAVMILAVESRGRPSVAHSGVAGLLGGFALVSDLGAAAMLLPLLVFGPLWCIKGTGLGLGSENGHGRDAPGAEPGPDAAGTPEPEPEPGWELQAGYDWADDREPEPGLDSDADKAAGEGKKWLPPLRHTGIGAVGLSLPLLPWLARNDAWADDAFYGFRDSFRTEYAQRYEPPRLDPGVGLQLGVRYDLQVDDRLGRQEIDFGADWLDDGPLFATYLGATEWGLGLGLATGVGLLAGGRRRRRQRLLYAAPAALGYGLGATLGDFDTTHPSAIGLLSVTTGSSLASFAACRRPWREVSIGGTLATGGLAVGLSGAYDCGYWDEIVVQDRFRPSLEVKYDFYDEWHLGVDYAIPGTTPDDPALDLEYEYEPDVELGAGDPTAAAPPEPTDEPAADVPNVPLEDPRDTPAAEYERPRERPGQPAHRPDVRPDRHQPNVRVRPGY